MIAQSRLSLLCEKFIQAGWLIALIVAPLYFNIYSSRVFEPDKIVLIRTLALVMGAAWLIMRAERWQAARPTNDAPSDQTFGQRLRGWVKRLSDNNPLTIPVLLLLLAYLISTLLSLSPTVSLFGSYQRLQGLYTFSAYVVIFFLAASQIKTRADVERAITIALITSFPIAFYGIIQHYFLDPLPWVGDVTSRVASNLGNSIFVGAFLILTIPLAIARLIQTGQRASTPLTAPRAQLYYGFAAFLTVIAVAAVWSASFDFGAKNLIESSYSGTLTPEQLSASSGAFNLALLLSLLIIAAWWGAAFLLKQRAANFLLTALYAVLIAIELDTLLFSQSRGPELGVFGGLFAFGVLFALVRGSQIGRRVSAIAILAIVGAGALLVVLLALINIPNSPLSSLRNLPYVGRLGQVFELEDGTGKVRVLIWEGALQLVLPHDALQSPTNGSDPLNAIRPLIGYGPETMYVAYNRFYPPELGQLESRNATPDRSHNETFDALVTTGLFGFIAENVLFLLVFYFGLKWLGLVPGALARNIFIGLWYGGGLVSALLFGLILGWQFIGVALPFGMILGFFTYVIVFALRSSPDRTLAPANALWFIALLSLFISHFIEIHFGIAIVSTRLYFWFFAAVFVVLGVNRVTMEEVAVAMPVTVKPEPVVQERSGESSADRARRKRPRPATVTAATAKREPARSGRVSAAPLITLAFLVGFVMAVMGFDYITTSNVAALGASSPSGLDVVLSALTVKNTTSGAMSSFALFWLFITTLGLALAICGAEWGRSVRLSVRDWAVSLLLFFALAFAVFSGLVFYHVILISSPSTGILDALLASVVLFNVYMLIVAVMTAVTMLFDEPLPAVWVRRATNWVVLPVLVLIAGALVLATNIDPVRADMLYKQASGQPSDQVATSIDLYERALALQPQQDYYMLFLGRAYLEAAKSATTSEERGTDLQKAQDALNEARQINPYNTDHSANLARLAQSAAGLTSDPTVANSEYKEASDYFDQATRLSPNTAHLYDQHAQELLESAASLRAQKDDAGAAQAIAQARAQVDKAMQVDDTFCLTYAVRAQTQDKWQDNVTDSLKAIELAPRCGDVFFSEGLSVAVSALADASTKSVAANQGDAFAQMLTTAVQTHPSLEVYTTLANYYSQQGNIPQAISAIDGALANISNSDAATQKRYTDFRYTLVQLGQALDAAKAAPNDPEAQRALAQQWLARGQYNLALPAFQKVVQLKPDDYAALRAVTLLLITTNQLPQASQQFSHTMTLAPTADQPVWQQLSTVLSGVQNGDPQTMTLIQDLAKNADQKDYALLSALRALAAKLQGTG